MAAPEGFENTFSGNPLDRLANERRDPEWIAEALAGPAARILPLHKLSIPVEQRDGALRLAWARAGEVDLSDAAPALLLGERGGEILFAADVSRLDAPPAIGEGYQDLRAAAAALEHRDASIAAQARAFTDWHARNGHCGQCGAETSVHEGGNMRKCGACEAMHFPRTDPVVITVVADEEECLLGRQASWPAGMFSALAGFVEHGESLEDAVRREVREESGILARDIHYHSSQPWPFPASLMIGCHAAPATKRIEIDDVEMDDVQWFSRSEVLESLSREPAQITDASREDAPLGLPGPMAIAHTLITAWAKGELRAV